MRVPGHLAAGQLGPVGCAVSRARVERVGLLLIPPV